MTETDVDSHQGNSYQSANRDSRTRVTSPVFVGGVVVALIVVLVGVNWGRQQRAATLPQPSASPTAAMREQEAGTSSSPAPVVDQLTLIATQSGQTVLELLASQAQVETKNFGEAGQFVESINGVAGDAGHYWAFYINGEYSQTGVNQSILTVGDVVDFIYEEITTDQSSPLATPEL